MSDHGDNPAVGSASIGRRLLDALIPVDDVAGVRERDSAKLVDDARPGNLGRHTFFCFVRPILSRFNESDDVRSPNFGPVANN